MESTSTPRVNSELLSQYVGRNVMVVGKVLQLRGDEATIEAVGTIQIKLNRDAHLTNGNGVQVIGRVDPDLGIKGLSFLDLGNDVDYTLSNAVVEVTHAHKDLFIVADPNALVH